MIINDFKLIKEAFNENTFSGRPDVPTIKDRSGGRPEGNENESRLFLSNHKFLHVTFSHRNNIFFWKNMARTT